MAVTPEPNQDRLMQEAAALAAQVQQLRGELASLEGRIANRQREEGELDARISQRRAEEVRMQEAATAQLAAVAGSVEQARQVINTLVERERELSGALETLGRRRDELRDEVADLRVERQGAESELANVRRQIGEEKVALQSLSEQRLALRDQVQAEEERARQTLATLSQQVTEAEARAAAAQERARATERQADATSQTLAALQADLVEARATRADLADDVERLTRERAELVASYRPLRPWAPAGPLKKRLVKKIKFSCQIPLVVRLAINAVIANPGLFPGYPSSLDELTTEAFTNYLPHGEHDGRADAYEVGMAMAAKEEEADNEQIEVVRRPQPGRRGPGRPPNVAGMRVEEPPVTTAPAEPPAAPQADGNQGGSNVLRLTPKPQ